MAHREPVTETAFASFLNVTCRGRGIHEDFHKLFLISTFFTVYQNLPDCCWRWCIIENPKRRHSLCINGVFWYIRIQTPTNTYLKFEKCAKKQRNYKDYSYLAWLCNFNKKIQTGRPPTIYSLQVISNV